MKKAKRERWSGAVHEKTIFNMPDGARNPARYEPEKMTRERFETDTEYLKFKENISRRNHYWKFMANFSKTSLYSTLTFDTEWEVHTFIDAKIIRRRLIRALKRKYPDAVIFLYMGRGKATKRIHFHMVSEGIPEEFISSKWKYGTVVDIEPLREHNYYDGVDHGADYAGLANYLFDHWTEEVGGHRWFQTKNAKEPDKDPPEELAEGETYSEKNPPEAPKGYKLVTTEATPYGYLCFKYVVVPPKDPRRSAAKNNRTKGRLDKPCKCVKF